MKFVVTGAAGHVSKPLTELLLKKGHDVTVVRRSPKNLEGLVKLGAKTAIGDRGDVPFLTETFKRADGVYLMLPPMWDSDDQKKQSIRYAEIFSSAIRANGVKNAVFLSSYGAGARRGRAKQARRCKCPQPSRRILLFKPSAVSRPRQDKAFTWAHPRTNISSHQFSDVPFSTLPRPCPVLHLVHRPEASTDPRSP
jgi:nucleoside-diphosphate-sugar epimerase